MRTLAAAICLSVALTAGGAVARQALQIQAGPVYPWRCPVCNTGNAGSPTERYRATCCRCRARFEWWDVLRPLTAAGDVALSR